MGVKRLSIAEADGAMMNRVVDVYVAIMSQDPFFSNAAMGNRRCPKSTSPRAPL